MAVGVVMRWIARVAIVVALAASALGPGAASSAQPHQTPPNPPEVDDLPPLPRAPTAVFDVIVEGEGEALRTVSVDGTNGVCSVTARTSSREVYEYGRGRGLRVSFTAVGPGASGVVLRRVGRSPAPVFNVRGKVTATGGGIASRTGPAALCPPTTETAGDEPRCGTRSAALNYGLEYARGKLALAPRGDALPPLPSPTPTECGQTSVESISGPPEWGFESPPPLTSVRLSRATIFGRARAFKRSLVAKPIDLRREPSIPGFVGSTREGATHGAIVRFVRVRD